ncbi:AAA domain-containing protein [Trichoderma pleuroticola]
MSRPDLYRVWGNTLLPCLLGGDDMQLPPTVMTKDEEDEDGHHRNRLGADGTMGLFNTCHREVYNDVPFNYGTGSDLGNHATGVNLERYLRARFPRLAPAAAGTLSEVFVHCEGTKCLVDEVTHSKRNPDQVLNALDFLADMVKTARISAADIAIITPYAANVELVNRRRMRPEYEALSAMPPAATVDSFQGREADIMVVIMGTTEEVGPGFTTDQHRLNVMLSRLGSGIPRGLGLSIPQIVLGFEVLPTHFEYPRPIICM